MRAAHKGNLGCLKKLIEHGADVNLKDPIVSAQLSDVAVERNSTVNALPVVLLYM